MGIGGEMRQIIGETGVGETGVVKKGMILQNNHYSPGVCPSSAPQWAL